MLVSIDLQLGLIKPKDPKKSFVFNQKHKFPNLSDEETQRIRTFSTFNSYLKSENDSASENAKIMMKIAYSEWEVNEFDISSLQKSALSIDGKGKLDDIA